MVNNDRMLSATLELTDAGREQRTTCACFTRSAIDCRGGLGVSGLGAKVDDRDVAEGTDSVADKWLTDDFEALSLCSESAVSLISDQPAKLC